MSMEQDAPVFFSTPYPELNAILEQVYRHRGADGRGSLRQLSEAVDKLTEKWAAARAPADSQPAPVLDESTPGEWFVRKLEKNGELVDCFVAAPDYLGFAYDAEILGDDEYRDKPESDETSGIRRKLADCELIVAAVKHYRAARANADSVTAPAGGAVAGPTVDMPSPWRAEQYSGYDTQYWTIKRRNPAWRGGTEIGMNGNCSPRRFKTEAAAQKAADELNAAARKQGGA